MISPEDILQTYWGYPSFRPLQKDIVMAAYEKKDALALLPTGGGKSVCFQVPVLMGDGMGIVISPLIALMQDQVDQLLSRNIPASAIYSGMSFSDMDRILDEAVSGQYRFLYVSPERLQTRLFIERFKQMPVSLIAVDEAHCISQWGYDFRPAYLEIPSIREWKPDVPVLALTATATPEVVQDIMQKLQLHKPLLFKKSFVRSNLGYVVRSVSSKLDEILHLLNKVRGSSVIYARSRSRVERIADVLQQKGISASFYHAGLDPSERSKRQENWIAGTTRVIVCTNAFGMGIDKPDVRIVIHVDPPESIEAYFQEAGRAGRDEKKAWAVFLTQPDDLSELKRKKKEGFPSMHQVRSVYDAICQIHSIAEHDLPSTPLPIDPGVVAKKAEVPLALFYGCIQLLEQGGFLSFSDNGHTQATLFVRATRDDLFLFMDRHAHWSESIRHILRSCSGIFEKPARIQEHKLAFGCGMSCDEFTRMLQTLHQYDLFTYTPASRLPEVTFLQPRYDSPKLPLSSAYIQERFADFVKKREAVIDYLENDWVCRTRFLVSYFGEQNDADCGICDVCRNQYRPAGTITRFDELCRILKTKIQSGENKIPDLFRIPDFSEDEIREAIQLLLDTETITIAKDTTLHWGEGESY